MLPLKLSGDEAANRAHELKDYDSKELDRQAEAAMARALSLFDVTGNESQYKIRTEMGESMEKGVGIYREEETMQETINVLKDLRQRIKNVPLTDRGRVFNTEWMNLIELGYTLDCAETMVHSAINRKESRGSHQRLDGPDGAYKERDDKNFLKHTLAIYNAETGLPDISYSDVKITTFQPAKRVYGAEAEAAEAAKKEEAKK